MEHGTPASAHHVRRGAFVARTSLGRSAALLRGVLAPARRLRTRLALASAATLGAAVPGLALGSNFAGGLAFSTSLACVAIAVMILSEFCERRLFFRAEAAPSMPGIG